MATDLATREHLGRRATSVAGPTARAPAWTAVGRALVPLVLVALSSLAPLVGDETGWPARGLLGGLAAGTLLCALSGHRASARLGLGLTATVAAGVLLPWQVGWWPLPGVVGVTVYLLAHVLAGDAPARHHPVFRFGRLSAVDAALALGVVVCSAAVLVVFSWFNPPRLGAGAQLLEGMATWSLVAVGVVFAAVNAFVEEVLFRGVVQQHLARVIGNWPAVLTQALAFGILHLNGYPYGPVGVTLASAYGLILGALRLHSRGLLTPWLAHACADAVIFTILVHTAA